MSEKKKGRPLSIEETVELFGAEPPEDIGDVQMDPISLGVLATKMGRKLNKGKGADMSELKESHRERHALLHKHLDELVADFITHTDGLPSKSTVFELIEWSYQQTLNPTKKAQT